MTVAARTPLWLGAALLLVALNLRLPFAGVPPIIDAVRDGLGLSHAAAGALTTLPVLCFAFAAPLAPRLARRFGDEPVILACLLLIAAGVAVRIMPAILPFYLGTVLLGLGIALANVLIPAVVKRWYPRPGAMTGGYVTVLTAGAALAAAATVPLERELGWQAALAVWGIPSVIAVAAWLPALRARHAPAGPPPPRVSLWRDRRAWLLTTMMGCQGLLFYAILAWTAEIVGDAGLADDDAGLMLALAMVLGIPTSLAWPVLAGRTRDQRPLVAVSAALWLAGLTGLLVSPDAGTAAWMVLLGLGQGAGFSLAMALVVLRAPDPPHAAALSGMVQSAGYAIAATGPFAVGVIHDLTGSWDAAIAFLIVIACALLVAGLGAARPGMIGVAHDLE